MRGGVSLTVNVCVYVYVCVQEVLPTERWRTKYPKLNVWLFYINCIVPDSQCPLRNETLVSAFAAWTGPRRRSLDGGERKHRAHLSLPNLLKVK